MGGVHLVRQAGDGWGTAHWSCPDPRYVHWDRCFLWRLYELEFYDGGNGIHQPGLILIAMFLILAWKTAGWWGVDRWLLPALGTPWQAGKVFKKT